MPFRGFIALETGAPERVVRLLDELRALDADLKVVRPENLHITVKFLGDVADEQREAVVTAMATAASGLSPTPYRIEGVGAFPKKGAPRVIWAGIRGELTGLAGAVGQLDRALEPVGFAPERRGWTAHLTLARSRSPGGARKIHAWMGEHRDALLAQDGVFRDFRLMRSTLGPTGPTYELDASAPFAADPEA